MATISAETTDWIIEDTDRQIRGAIAAQLQFYGLKKSSDTRWSFPQAEPGTKLLKIINYLERGGVKVRQDESAQPFFEALERAEEELSRSLKLGLLAKAGQLDSSEVKKFISFVSNSLPRRLRNHQLKSAIHMLASKNSANFSVPGAGKTSVVLAVYQWLKKKQEIQSMLVVGPPSCFRPWQEEFRSTLGYSPSYEILAGGNVEERHLKYYRPEEQQAELYLTSFQTLQRDIENTRHLLTCSSRKFLLIIDEAHYIKQVDGSRAKAVLDLAPLAQRRIVLTGTPFPHSYVDAFNLFDVLHPSFPTLKDQDKVQIRKLLKDENHSRAANLLKSKIYPLFYRVKKEDLGLAAQIFVKPFQIPMNPIEKELYRTIFRSIEIASKDDFLIDLETVSRLKRGRMIRLRQSVSYSGLLRSAIDDYTESLFQDELGLSSRLFNYDEHEKPAKLEFLSTKIDEHKQLGNKIVVWSNFIQTLSLIKSECDRRGWSAEIICGNTPKENSYTSDLLTREEIIDQFKKPTSGLDILIANPAACAESVSLHKTCSTAMYYDLSYNCAQYLQSLDRIHRVGGSEDKESTYYYLQYKDTFENDILENILQKQRNMERVIDSELPSFGTNLVEDDEGAYDRIFKG